MWTLCLWCQSYLASTRLAVFGRREMLSTTPRTPSPLWSMEVETLCFRGVSQLRGQDDFTVSRGGWMGPCTGTFWATSSFPQWEHWKWVVDGSSNMTMTQNIRPRQQRSGSKRSILSKSHRKSVEGAEASSCQAIASEPLRIWRGSAKKSWPKSLPRSVQTCWKTTTNVWPLCLPTKVSPPSIKSYCSMDQILISCENMIMNI